MDERPVSARVKTTGRRFVAVLAATTVLAAGCSATGSKGTDDVLTIGTTYYISTLNPFVGIETQDSTAYSMLYPQLVQYGPGLKLEGDWATEWTESPDGHTITFKLRDGKWSDGQPLTADDAVWTIDTIRKYAEGATASMAKVLAGVASAEAPDPHTLVIHYDQPTGPAMANLEQMYIVPKHVWEAHATGDDGSGLTDFKPEQQLPVVAGGPFTITKFEDKGTTVFTPNPDFYGPKPNASAVALTYYTNPTALIADLKAGRLGFVDNIPFKDAAQLKSVPGITLASQPGNEVTNFGFNSSDAKKLNRELLDPKLREAFEYALPREQIVGTVFGGEAKPWANILSGWSGDWVNPEVKPLPNDVGKANQILDSLGYQRGPDGLRIVPATTGEKAQPAHPMRYSVIVPNDTDYDGHLQFTLLKSAFEKVGVELTEQAGGDGTQAYELITAPDGEYEDADMFTWYWHPYIDPDFNLGVVTTSELGNNSDTGWSNPAYDELYERQRDTVDPAARRALVWQAEAEIATARPYIQIVETNLVTASSDAWTGFEPELFTLGKAYYTSPKRA
ncbi:peptide ABC transporter substrate-binding protein [Mycobacterium sp. CVI_P3]|uniref:Peptide ABC transporter substrate-binding protein n=1 Tax=Mycobacterium pinniadriaticum TaxID=2994102 RepID=A0ABT3SBJ9_9MYCO|nr:peptide ABC transporter substrate-binding protein [Mycobacterium pinniadriaticum]MCX2930480.1 peptide ABC transporter substrate-binding protein [Mycobacterium pinniadriaticum]MCX2936904.1 peptide ABC transporter substrate-binding protein [Mycobacterium pinniadriaticum]